MLRTGLLATSHAQSIKARVTKVKAVTEVSSVQAGTKVSRVQRAQESVKYAHTHDIVKCTASVTSLRLPDGARLATALSITSRQPSVDIVHTAGTVGTAGTVHCRYCWHSRHWRYCNYC
jgi:hypothetical protein